MFGPTQYHLDGGRVFVCTYLLLSVLFLHTWQRSARAPAIPTHSKVYCNSCLILLPQYCCTNISTTYTLYVLILHCDALKLKFLDVKSASTSVLASCCVQCAVCTPISVIIQTNKQRCQSKLS